jgi:hypothetical protein
MSAGIVGELCLVIREFTRSLNKSRHGLVRIGLSEEMISEHMTIAARMLEMTSPVLEMIQQILAMTFGLHVYTPSFIRTTFPVLSRFPNLTVS